MKLWNSRNGFGISEVIIIVVIVGALGLVGAKAYTSRNDQPATGQTTNQTANETDQSNQNGDNDQMAPIGHLEPYTLPAGWTQMACGERIAINPPQTTAPNCQADQPNTVVVMYIDENVENIDPQSCSVTNERRNMDYAGHASYECQDVTVDGQKGIRETVTDTERGFAGEAVYTTYTFPSDGKLLIIDYSDIKNNGYPSYLKDFDAFVQSLTFKE